MNEERLLRQTRWLLLAVTTLFGVFGYATTRVEGFGVTALALYGIAVCAFLTLLWLTIRRKVAVLVVIALLAGGIGINHNQPALACTRGTYDCELLWAAYKIKVQIWFDKNTLLNNCLLASNLRDGPTRAYCYSKYNPGPFPKPPA